MRHQFARGSLLLYPAYVQDYLDRVTAADVTAGNSSGLERGVTDAASTFLRDLVSISYLGVSSNVISQAASVIKAMPIMAGARTRQGALGRVVGPAPTEFGTAEGWNYNRKTGLAGNGIDTYLNSNRNNNADPQNSKHIAIYATTRNTEAAVKAYIGATFSAAGSSSTQIVTGIIANKLSVRCSDGTTVTTSANLHSAAGFFGISRSSGTSYIARGSSLNETINTASVSSSNGSYFVFARNLDGAPNLYSNGRVSAYSIGEFLDLALLDVPITTLLASYAAAIP